MPDPTSGPVLQSQRNAARAAALFDFTHGIDVDRRLAAQETAVQTAWARALARAGLLSAHDAQQVGSAMDEARRLMEVGEFDWQIADEDIHMNLERFVTQRHGTLGKRMHVGRSRNDLIATTLRLFVRDACSDVRRAAAGLGLALTNRAAAFTDTIVPGMTHLQHAQPIRLGHAFAAHAFSLSRDLSALDRAAQNAVLAMPLGAAAMAGTTIPIDLSALARDLGFRNPPQNAYDAVGDRDFMLDALNACATLALHLSRISEDVIFWSSSPVGLLRLPPAWSTGSSIMPNKRNPDVPELVRAKSAHIMACVTDGFMLMKALPSSYDSDMHELKRVLLRSVDDTLSSLGALTPFTAGLEVNSSRAAALLSHGHLLATELADELARQGVPFRDAYAKIAALVEQAEAKHVQIHELPEARAILPDLSFESAVERRKASGGTARAPLTAALASLRAVFSTVAT